MTEHIRYSKPGNTMPEYALVGLLVVAVGVAALLQLGKGLDNRLDDFNGSLVLQSGGASTVDGSHTSSVAATGTVSPELIRQIELLSMEELAQTTMVAGANGATEQMASTLKDYINHLLAEKEITAKEGDLLMRLANEGHALATTERNIENAVLEGGSEVSYQGKTYSLQEFSAMLNEDVLLSKDAGLMSGAFVNMYNQVKDAGLLSDPVIGVRVGALSERIMVLAYLTKKNLNDTLATPRSRDEYNQRLSQEASKSYAVLNAALEKSMAQAGSDMTDDDSQQLCETGHGQDDQGRQCRRASLHADDARLNHR